MFDDKPSFEAYNFGHLMTAACVHYRATGKTNVIGHRQESGRFLIDVIILLHPSRHAMRYALHTTWA